MAITREQIGISILTVLLAFGTAMVTSGQQIGAISAQVKNNKQELDVRAATVNTVGVLEVQIDTLDKNVMDNKGSIQELVRALTKHNEAFHQYKIEQMQLQSAQNRKLDQILDRLER